MLIRDLIKMLEEEYQRQLPHAEMLGEPEVWFDVYDLKNAKYLGITPHPCFDNTTDGVYRILMGDPRVHENSVSEGE